MGKRGLLLETFGFKKVVVVAMVLLAVSVGAAAAETGSLVLEFSSTELGGAQADTGESAAISADGRWVVFNEEDGTGVVLFDDNSGSSIVVDPDGFNGDVSDDGRWVTYSKFADGAFDVLLWDRLNPGSPQNLSSSEANSFWPTISGSGDVVAWREEAGDRFAHVWNRVSGTIAMRAAGLAKLRWSLAMGTSSST